MISQLQLQTALKSKSITDYLYSLGVEPESSSGVRWKYLCPFPEHKETKPSFVVFRNSDIETFWCFGCNFGYSLIHLISRLEGLTFKQALEKISPDNISSDDEIKFLLNQIETAKQVVSPDTNVGTTLINISRLCLTYMHKVKYDPEEAQIMDKFYCQIDKDILDLNVDNLDRCSEVLPKILCQRKEKFRQKKLLERKKEIKKSDDDLP